MHIRSIIRLAPALGAIQTMLSSRSPKRRPVTVREPHCHWLTILIFLEKKKLRHLDRHAVPVPVAVTPTSWRPVSHCRHRTNPAYNSARGTGGSTSTSWRRTPGAEESHRLRRDASRVGRLGLGPGPVQVVRLLAGCVHYCTVHERLHVQVPLCSAVLV